MATWFETHAHLADAKFDADRDAVIQAAFSAGVQTLVEIADGPDEWPKALQLAESYPQNFFWAAGIHPYYADQATPENLQRLKNYFSHPQFVAVGEIGLDYAKSPIPSSVQIPAFQKLMELAFDHQKPVVIHCRDAFHDLIPLLKELCQKYPSSKKRGVIHCFTGQAKDAKECVDLGFFLGVDAPITYPSAKALREAFKTVTLADVVLETDSPYLPPQAHRGQRNEPRHIPLIGGHLALLLGCMVDELKKRCQANSFELFQISPR